MINTFYRSALLLLILCSAAGRVAGQQIFRNFSIGVGAGVADSYTDRAESEGGYLAQGTLDYFFTPYLNAGLELQGGRISGYSKNNTDGRETGFNSEFATFQVRGKVHAGEFIGRPRRYRVVHSSFLNRVGKGLYLGTGAGIIVLRSRPGSEASYQNKELYLPAMAGVDVNLREGSRLMLNLNYQMNFVLGDKIDGLVSPGSKNDMFSSFSIGLAYTFGRLSYL